MKLRTRIICPRNEAVQTFVNGPCLALEKSKLGMTPLSHTTHVIPNFIEFLRVIFHRVMELYWITSLEMVDGQTCKQVGKIGAPFLHDTLMFIDLCRMIVKFACEFLGEDNVAMIILSDDI